jgi:hypothetical protein
MILTRTEQIWLPPNEKISELCHYSKNLWNEANYKSEQNAFQKWYADGVGGCGLHPMRVNPLGGIIS